MLFAFDRIAINGAVDVEIEFEPNLTAKEKSAKMLWGKKLEEKFELANNIANKKELQKLFLI